MKRINSISGGDNGFWRNDTTYNKIINFNSQHELTFDDFSECDSGFCGL